MKKRKKRLFEYMTVKETPDYPATREQIQAPLESEGQSPKGEIALMGKIDLLRPEARPYFVAFLNKLETAGLRYTVTETLRTPEVQAAYYAQGRKPLAEVNELRKKAGLYLLTEAEGKKIVTQTMRSAHLTGCAADVVPVIDGKIPWSITAENAMLWLEFGILGREAGLEWGGEWEPFDRFGIGWDAPHYQRLGD